MQVFLDFNSKKMQNQIRKKCKKQCYIVVHLVVSLRYIAKILALATKYSSKLDIISLAYSYLCSPKRQDENGDIAKLLQITAARVAYGPQQP